MFELEYFSNLSITYMHQKKIELLTKEHLTTQQWRYTTVRVSSSLAIQARN